MWHALALLVCCWLFTWHAVTAQLSITWAHVDPFCDSGLAPKAIGAVHWSGGVPPYTVTITFPGEPFLFQYDGIMASPHFVDESLGNYIDLAGAVATVSDGGGGYDSAPVVSLGAISTIANTVGMFAFSLSTTDCALGIYTASFADNPLREGDLFTEPLTGYSYVLWKDGTPHASGSLDQVLQTNPERLEFSGLTQGEYILELDFTTGIGQAVMYCPEVPGYSFCVPNANDCQTNVQVRVALASVLGSGGLMSDGLRAAGLLPLVEPYSAMGYTYVGTAPGASTTPGLLAVAGTEAIVDWVVIELRGDAAPHPVLASRPALLQRDGDVIDLDGDPYVSFPVAAGSYKVAVRHRNHLGVMTSTSYTLNVNPCRGPDLIRTGVVTYGTGGRRLMTVPGVVGNLWALWPGDATGDGTVSYVGSGNDRDAVLNAIGGTMPTNTVNNVYDRRDVDLDGSIKYVGANNDRDVILQTIGGVVPTNTRGEQLP